MSRTWTVATRGPAWTRLAEEVRAAHGHRCARCDRPQAENLDRLGKVHKLSVDHVRPLGLFLTEQPGNATAAIAAANARDNLVPTCLRCHGLKTAKFEQAAFVRGDVLDQRRYERVVHG